MTAVGAQWLAALTVLGGDAAAGQDAAAQLSRRYAEPHRRYHDTSHVEAVLSDAAWLAAQVGLDAPQRALLALAACAHDVVYDGRPGADEQASAAWARTALRAASVPPADVARVEALVLATADHVPTGDPVADVLLDADLAVLGAPPARYADYVAAVRAEYAHVPQPAWCSARAAVLRSLVSGVPLYRTPPAVQRWEDTARHNVAAELAALDVR